MVLNRNCVTGLRKNKALDTKSPFENQVKVRIRRGLDFKHLNSKKKDFMMKNVDLATN